MPLKMYGLLFTTTFLSSLAFVVCYFGLIDFPPLLFAGLRFAAFVPLLAFVPKPDLPWAKLGLYAFLIGVVYAALMNLSLFMGLQPGVASLLVRAESFFTILLGIMLLNDKPKRRTWEGIIVSLTGLLLIACHGKEGLFESVPILGVFCILLGLAAKSLGLILTVGEKQASPIHLMVWLGALAAFPLLGLSAIFEGPTIMIYAITHASLMGWGSVIYMSYIAMLFAGVVWIDGLRRYGPSKIVPLSSLMPIYGMGASILFTEESFTFIKGVATFLVVFGIYITQGSDASLNPIKK